jgi:hypothetical protein
LLEAVEMGQTRVHDLQHEVEKARVALDRTDAVLASADKGFTQAESAIATTKKWTPVGLVVLGAIVVVGVATVIVLRRRRGGRNSDVE